MLIPYQQLDSATLDNLIEAFVLREGTDYGELEMALAEKVSQIRQQIKAGQVVIVYSELHESVDLLTKQQWQTRLSEQDPDS
ncbi:MULTISPECIES: YheU family protein [Rheinheimera]|uniref:YheU family protein n=1 Tax=Rheinheimera marina TaxID=1774958 RepID=A0ABV9JH22_9GAMM